MKSKASSLFKTTIVAATLSILFAMAAVVAQADTWNLDPVHSSITFSARHMMISDVKGQFDKFSGTITIDGSDPSTAKIDVTIDASSVDTHSDKRDMHLRSPDFLDATKYPTITFKSTKIEPAGSNWKVTGDLTLHGVTKPVVLDVTGPSAQIMMMGAPRRGASATTKIDRQAFGVSFNKTLDSGGLVVGNEIPISIEVEAVKAK